MDNTEAIEQAKVIVEYYEHLATKPDGGRWVLGLYMAKRWYAMLQSESVAIEEVELYIKALEAERDNQGSGWLDLLLRVKNWSGHVVTP